MKNLSFLTLLILFIMSTNLRGQWEILNEGVGFHTIDFVNENVGWNFDGNTLFKTEDGGDTWIAIQSFDMDIDMVDFVSESVGWGVYRSVENDNCKLVIIKTINGGQNWDVIREFEDPDIYYWINRNIISAVNDTILYVIGTDGTTSWIRKTTDGGSSWHDVSPESYKIPLNRISFLNSEIGFVTGDVDETDYILKTTNGGRNWVEIIAPDLRSVHDFQFIDDSIGYFLADIDSRENILFVTTDTLKTWTMQTLDSVYISSYFALDKNTIFAIMDMDDDSVMTNIMKSTNRGQSWDKKQSLYSNGEQVYFNSGGKGFVTSGYRTCWFGCRYWDPNLWISRDEGNTWVVDRFSASATDVFFINSNTGFISCICDFSLGHGDIHWYVVFRTNDAGSSWNIMPDLGIKASTFISDDVGFAVANRWVNSPPQWHYYILKTTDGGTNWSEIYHYIQFSDVDIRFKCTDLYFINDQIGWIVGSAEWEYLWRDLFWRDLSGAGILGTTDGGENWELIWKYANTDLYQYRLNSIHYVNITGWAVGESGLIVKYTEQDQWQLQPSITDLPLNKVFFSDEQHGWITGGYFDEDNVYLKLYKTIDGGENWQEIPDFEYQINDMYFADSLHGWVVGNDTSYNGTILETEDGGNSWTTQVEGLSAPLNALHFKDGYGWAVGDNGLVLRTEDGGGTWINEQNNKVYPNNFSLSQNYPNPFNPKTIINYELQMMNHVDLSIYNILGEKVSTLVSEKQQAGYHQAEWDASGFASGIYYYRIQTDEFQDVKKMVLLR